MGDAAVVAGESAGRAESLVVGEADIGSEFAAEFITDTQASIELGKAGADAAARIVLAVEVELELGLGDQPVGDEKIVRTLDAAGDAALVAKIEGGRELEEIGGQAFDADRAPSASGSGIEVVTDPGLRVEILKARDRMVVERLGIAVGFDAVFDDAFGLEPELVH